MRRFVFTLFCFFVVVSGYSLTSNVRPVRFALLADLHISEVASNVEDLEISVRDINSLKGIDFVIFAGDITEFGSDEEILLAKSIIDKLNVPYYIVAGNHDSKWSESGCNTFSRVFGYEHFNFNFGGVQFIGTNSGPNMRMAPALVPRESVVWLDSVTRALPPGVPVVFVNHYPLDDAMLNYSVVIDLLRRVNIQVSLCGHGHSNRVLDFSGVRGVMGRSNLRGGKVAAGHAGYNLVSIEDGTISFRVRSNGVTGEVWHSMRLLGRGENSAAYPVSVVWDFQDDSDIGSAAAFGFGMVYVANSAGVIKALDAADGTVRWSYKTGGKVFSSPGLCEVSGSLVVGSSDNFIYCLDARSGKLRWRAEAGKSVLGSPEFLNGVVYIGASDNSFRAIDVKSGSTLWVYSGIKGFIEAKPWVDAGGVYIGDWASRLYAFNPKSGELKWSWTNGKGRGLSPAAVWPVKANGKVFVVTPERMCHAIDAATGKELWSRRGGREAIGLSQDGSAVYVKTMQDTVIAYSTKESVAVKLWESHAGFGYEIAPSPLTNAYGLVFVPTDKGNIFALREGDGSVAWQYRFSGALINYVRPIGDRRVLVTSMDGRVAILKVQ